MSTSINVIRYHLIQRFNYLILPWAILVFVFGVDAVILAFTPAGHYSHRWAYRAWPGPFPSGCPLV
jgi:hypothetical protein